MITRIWHGYTTFTNADAYETLLRTAIFTYIEAKKLKGYRRIELYRRELDGEIEFITIMWFESLEDIVAFAGPDYALAVVLPEARALLTRYDAAAQHYEVTDSVTYPLAH